MNRTVLVLLLFSVFLGACSKSNGIAEQVKAQGVIDDKIVTDYLTAKGIAINRVDTSGVCYVVDTVGTGNDLFTSATQVTLGYTAALLTTGKIFEQTDSFHPTFVLGSVIRGWQLGIPKDKKGGTITLYVPSRYAYGPYAQPELGLPANAILIFNIKIYNIIN